VSLFLCLLFLGEYAFASIVRDEFILFAPLFDFLTPKVSLLFRRLHNSHAPPLGGSCSDSSAALRPKASGFPQQQKLLAKIEVSQKE